MTGIMDNKKRRITRMVFLPEDWRVASMRGPRFARSLPAAASSFNGAARSAIKLPSG
jgi:hypothetical protein